jgi:hypothetical protein
MKTYRVLIVSCFVMKTLVGLLDSGECAQQSVESVLVNWEEASRKCQILDAKLEIIHYNRVFSDKQPVCTQGRFYYEAPNFARYESGTEHIVWSSEGLFINNKQDKTCMFWSSQTIQTVQQSMGQMPETTFWQRLWKGYCSMFTLPARLSQQDDLLPLFLNINIQREKQRFDFTIQERDGKIIVKAIPKLKKETFREIDVMLDADSYLLLAHRLIAVSGDITVRVFDNMMINKAPPDREVMITPIPPGYDVFKAEDMFGSKSNSQPQKIEVTKRGRH